MQVAIIAPIPQLKFAQLGSIHMALAHLVLKSPLYAKFYTLETKFKILDNGTFEGEPIKFDTVIELAKQIKAQEIVLPDVMYDSNATKNLVIQTLAYLKERQILNKYRWLAVVQGRTEEEWWDCFHFFNQHPDINTIGINKLSTPLAFGGTTASARLYVTRVIEQNKWNYPGKEYHLLGGSHEIIHEVTHQPSWIRSIDSSAPVVYGNKCKYLALVIKPIKGPVDFDAVLIPQCIQYILKNIEEVVRGGK